MNNRLERYTWTLTRALKKFNDTIMVVGLGRCGTTLIEESIIDNHHYKRHPDYLYVDRFADVNRYSKGYIYKTHDYPPNDLPDHVKLIFMFGNPMNIALSTYNMINKWGREHHYHLNSDLFRPNDDVIKKDTMRLNELFIEWYRPHNFSFISIKYESLYDTETLNSLSDFIGFSLKLFPRKKRTSDWKTSEYSEQLKATYANLAKKIDASEPVKIWTKI